MTWLCVCVAGRKGRKGRKAVRTEQGATPPPPQPASLMAGWLRRLPVLGLLLLLLQPAARPRVQTS